ncbi:MAG: helix-turn-helix domain-containing protein [Candidatus Celaenobacter antarcticus]|nr:helix-turn-helix domain-containing protein [Candidatus Celaenobacter antarcticus]MDP8315218.1 helix-turn-helix domain-containing protein [Candidatus Celaenobacter antarcticus]
MQNIINKLIKIGLAASEARVYYYLLKKEYFTAGEISKLAEVSPSKIYSILSKLEKKGLCTETLGRVKKYSPVNPKAGFEFLHDELKKMEENISELPELLSPIYHSEKGDTNPLDYIKVLRDKNSITRKFESLEKESIREVLSLVKGPLVIDISKPYNQEQFSSLERGVNFKTIYDAECLDTPFLMESIEKFNVAGEEVRIAVKISIPFKMYIYDKRKVMFTLEDKTISETKLTGLIIEHIDLVKGLKQIFDLYWQSSITLEEFKMKENIT